MAGCNCTCVLKAWFTKLNFIKILCGFFSFKIDVIYFFILQQPCTFNHNFLLRSVLLFFFVSAKLHPCMHKWTSLRIDNKWMKGSHVLNTKMYTFHPTMTIKKHWNWRKLPKCDFTISLCLVYSNTYCLISVYRNESVLR